MDAAAHEATNKLVSLCSSNAPHVDFGGDTQQCVCELLSRLLELLKPVPAQFKSISELRLFCRNFPFAQVFAIPFSSSLRCLSCEQPARVTFTAEFFFTIELKSDRPSSLVHLIQQHARPETLDHGEQYVLICLCGCIRVGAAMLLPIVSREGGLLSHAYVCGLGCRCLKEFCVTHARPKQRTKRSSPSSLHYPPRCSSFNSSDLN